MKGKIISFIVGLLFLAACFVFVAQTFFNITIFESLAGWWTVFIILPGLLGLFKRGTWIGSLGMILVGGSLLAREQGWFGGILSGVGVWQIIVAALLLVIGLSIICGVLGYNRGNCNCACGDGVCDNCGDTDTSTVFSSRRFDFSGKEFKGIKLDGVFGAVELDLRNAIINTNCVVEANSVFGTVTVFTGDNANYKTLSTTIFGGVNDKSIHSEVIGLPEVCVKCNAVFGSVELR